MPALQFDDGWSESSRNLRHGLATHDVAAVARRGNVVALRSPAGERAAHLPQTVGLVRIIEPGGVRPVADADAMAAEAAATDEVADGQQPSTSLRSLPGRIWRALKRLEPMFPPMSCC
ncbi:hypothetical protein OO17_01505 [Rhodopseudomonas palustris]|uniref:Uncharacterized protein n=2 Tax=Nitrobacteraceae TaxID=41294 RepID=A0A0D7F595_RHOPL|nr:hypothetical protein OO17_01505 [Rhodopseudomonas palustris]